LGMCYCSLATVTDYDCWFEEDVTIEIVIKTMNECLSRVLKLLELGLPKIHHKECNCINAAKGCGAL
jgi:5'-methylthioadenosine phosphorylase